MGSNAIFSRIELWDPWGERRLDNSVGGLSNLEACKYMGVEPNILLIPPKIDGEHFMENPIKMDDLGGKKHYFWKHPYYI